MVASSTYVRARDVSFPVPVVPGLRAMPDVFDERDSSAVAPNQGSFGPSRQPRDAPVESLPVDVIPEPADMIAEPPSGMRVLARDPMHHTAGDVYHRDDREGHNDPGNRRVWWWHDGRRWVSWRDIVRAAKERGRVLMLLYADPLLPGCAVDGAHDPDVCQVKQRW